jgi:hypothetical protein
MLELAESFGSFAQEKNNAIRIDSFIVSKSACFNRNQPFKRKPLTGGFRIFLVLTEKLYLITARHVVLDDACLR